MYTVYCEYHATGEGITYMVLFTQAFGEGESFETNALDEFKELFGDYYAIGAKVEKGVYLNFAGVEYLLTKDLQKFLEKHKDSALLKYNASFHCNFS